MANQNEGTITMNNYCTNCGKKLTNNEFFCQICGTPIIKLPDGYVSPEKKKKRKIILTTLIILAVIITISKKEIYINNLKKEYIIPYLQEHYPNQNSKVKYKESGKCITYGDCYFDPVFGCDGGWCKQYEYLDESECTSYYFKITNDTEEFILTVVKKNNETYVVRGKNIYGKDDPELERNENE